MNLGMSVQECSRLLNKGSLFIRNAIKNRTLPGSYTESHGRTDFFIPRRAIYEYLGMSEEEIEQYEKKE